MSIPGPGFGSRGYPPLPFAASRTSKIQEGAGASTNLTGRFLAMAFSRSILWTVGVCIAATLTAGGIPAQDATYWEKDVDGLRETVAKMPDNLGLKLRLAAVLVIPTRETAHPDAARAHLAEAQKNLDGILEARPDATVPLRVLCRWKYLDKKLEETVDMGRRFLAQFPGDPEVSRLLIKALVRLDRGAEAAQLYVDWIKTGNVPSYGQAVGLLQTLLLRKDVREPLEKLLCGKDSMSPRFLHVYPHKAALLMELGRAQEAWQTVPRGRAPRVVRPADRWSPHHRQGTRDACAGAGRRWWLPERGRVARGHREEQGSRWPAHAPGASAAARRQGGRGPRAVRDREPHQPRVLVTALPLR